MVQVLSIESRRAQASAHFDRAELVRLLALYSRRVAEGEWRDYAIDQMPGRAEFSVFRHTMEKPVFTISKWTDGAHDHWEVASGPRKLHQADSLDGVLRFFHRGLRVAHYSMMR